MGTSHAKCSGKCDLLMNYQERKKNYHLEKENAVVVGDLCQKGRALEKKMLKKVTKRCF